MFVVKLIVIMLLLVTLFIRLDFFCEFCVSSLNKEGRDLKVKLIDFNVIKPLVCICVFLCVFVCMTAIVMKYRFYR